MLLRAAAAAAAAGLERNNKLLSFLIYRHSNFNLNFKLLSFCSGHARFVVFSAYTCSAYNVYTAAAVPVRVKYTFSNLYFQNTRKTYMYTPQWNSSSKISKRTFEYTVRLHKLIVSNSWGSVRFRWTRENGICSETIRSRFTGRFRTRFSLFFYKHARVRSSKTLDLHGEPHSAQSYIMRVLHTNTADINNDWCWY